MQHPDRRTDPQHAHEQNGRAEHAQEGGAAYEQAGRTRREPDAQGGAARHPLGTGAGAVGGAAAGAAIGAALSGPAGAAVGGIIGALGGGAAGYGISEGVNPAAEDRYWRENYRSRPYTEDRATYALYRPAYRFGWEARVRYFDRRWEDVESTLAREWETRHESELTWPRARPAAYDAWQRVELRVNG